MEQAVCPSFPGEGCFSATSLRTGGAEPEALPCWRLAGKYPVTRCP